MGYDVAHVLACLKGDVANFRLALAQGKGGCVLPGLQAGLGDPIH